VSFLLKCLNLQKQGHNVYSCVCLLFNAWTFFLLYAQINGSTTGYLLFCLMFSLWFWNRQCSLRSGINVTCCIICLEFWNWYQIEEQLHVFLAESLVEWFFQADTRESKRLFSREKTGWEIFFFLFFSTLCHVVALYVKLFSLAKQPHPPFRLLASL